MDKKKIKEVIEAIPMEQDIPFDNFEDKKVSELKKVNERRIKMGLKPFYLKNGKPINEAKILNWLEEKINKTPIDKESKKMVESIIRQSNNCSECETIVAIKAATKFANPTKNIARYKVAKQLRKESIANVFLSDINDFYNNILLNENIKKLSILTNSKIKLEGENLHLNEEKLNEFFSKNAYEKFLDLLTKAEDKAETLRHLSTMYSDDWQGNEKAIVQDKLKTIFKNFTQGSIIKKRFILDKIDDFVNRDAIEHPEQIAAFPKLRKFATESKKFSKKQLNEMYVKNEFNKLINILDNCVDLADKVHDLIAGDKLKIKANAKEILISIKHIWKTFNKTRGASIDNKISFRDPINSMSHKPYEKQMNNKTSNVPIPNTVTPKIQTNTENKLSNKISTGAKKMGNTIADQFREDEDEQPEYLSNK